MKKFLIFLVSIVVVVCVGLTTFYFMKNDEIIVIEAKEIYVNAGDTITLEELGFSRKKASKKTTFNYNAGGEDVQNAVYFDDSKGYYIVKGEVAGDVNLVITTSNDKYAEFTVTVHIGNGEKETPYYVFNETDLSKIGADYGLNKYFRLMNNIVLSSSFTPVGYSELDSKYVGFSGNFDGNGKTISALNLTNLSISNAGLFSSINASAVVSNLTISNATISGEYAYAGALAGEILGNVDRIAVLSSVVTSTANNSNIGALAGRISGSVKLAYADSCVVNAGADNVVKDVAVGGLFGKVNQASVLATYVNNTNVNISTSSTGKFGGLAGEFVIDDNKGSIQQSYANVNSEETSFGAFLGGITTSYSFSANEQDVIRYLIGNAVVLNGKEIITSGNYNTSYFSTFKDTAKANYFVDSYSTAGEMQIQAETNGLVFYAMDITNIILWDTEYIWQTSTSSLPTLRFTRINPELPSGEYFRKDLTNNIIDENVSTFKDIFNTNISNMKYTLYEDVTLTDWTPVNLTNVTLDGNGKTITLALTSKYGQNLGLFGKLDNCTIKNLNIVVTGVSANATNVGAVAGEITSSDSSSISSLENITISFNNVGNITATNFGSVVGVAENTNIKEVSLTKLNLSANISNVGGLVANLKENSTITNSSAVANLKGNEKVGGLVAVNNGSISNSTNSNVTITYECSTISNALVGGMVAQNDGNIVNSTANVSISVNNAKDVIKVGGISAINNGTISASAITGSGVAVSEMSANVYIGGMVAENNSTIELTKCEITSVGAVYLSKNIYAGGVAYINAGTISKVVTKTNVYGNYAAGVVVEMNNAKANVDQVVVNNSIKGDKYVAGVAVILKAGSITNIQASSAVEGVSNSTRSSLVTLIFPYGASLKNATIDSSIGGYGTFYRDAWIDFAAYSNKSEFGFAESETGDARFNLYDNDTHHGCMQSVVVNTARAGVSSAKVPMSTAFAWGKEYTDSSESSFIKPVDGFSSVSQFTGKFEFVCSTSTTFGIKHKVTRSLTFEIGTIWTDNGSGISLSFVSNL